jgi:hypothetical protein
MSLEERNGSKSPKLDDVAVVVVVVVDDDLQEARCEDMEWINPT